MKDYVKVFKGFTSTMLILFMLVGILCENQSVVYAIQTNEYQQEMIQNGTSYTSNQMKNAALEAIELYKAGKGHNAYLDPFSITFRDKDMDGILELYIAGMGGAGDLWGDILKFENGNYEYHDDFYIGKGSEEDANEVYMNKNKEYLFLQKTMGTLGNESLISVKLYNVQTGESKYLIGQKYNFVEGISAYNDAEGKSITKAVADKIISNALKGYKKVDISYKFVSLIQGKYAENVEEAWNAYKIKSTEEGNIKVAQVKSLIQAKPYSTTSITMKWNKFKNATGYEIYRATSKNGTYKKVKTTKATSYKQGKLTRGKTYYYKVRAYKIVDGKTKYGKFSSVKVMGTKPKTTSIKVYAGNNKAKVVWKKISDISGYDVYMSTSKKGTYSKIKTSGSKNTEYLKTGLAKGKTYFFKVRSYRNVGGEKIYSSWSQVKSVKVK